MHILIATDRVIPVFNYGGTERVIWYLGQELKKMGHQVTYLAPPGSHCHFANVVVRQQGQAVHTLIPEGIDLVHYNSAPDGLIDKPYVVTMHGNTNEKKPLDLNTIFVSENHASRFGSNVFVHNGLDWNDYGKPATGSAGNSFHFLGNAAWRVKNVRGAIKSILDTPGETLEVLGGTRLNIKMGFRFTWSTRIHFHGMVGGEKKLNVLKHSRGLVFPVLWEEPFGLAITESMYFGAPVFGTPYGSLPELVTEETGYLTDNSSQLTAAITNYNSFSRSHCHQRAADLFNSRQMAVKYVTYYEKVLSGKNLHELPPQLKQVQQTKFLSWN